MEIFSGSSGIEQEPERACCGCVPVCERACEKDGDYWGNSGPTSYGMYKTSHGTQ